MAAHRVIAYSFTTRAGEFWIRLARNGRWIAQLEDEVLDSYATPQQAAEDLARGRSVPASAGDALELPSDVTKWRRVLDDGSWNPARDVVF